MNDVLGGAVRFLVDEIRCVAYAGNVKHGSRNDSVGFRI